MNVMNRVLRNLLPQDTRAVEYLSAMSLIWIAPSFFLGEFPSKLTQMYPAIYWGIVLLAFGILHLMSLAVYPKLRPLRTVIIWASGTLWLWIGFHPHSADLVSQIPIIFLGLSCLYAFVINTTILSEIWKQ